MPAESLSHRVGPPRPTDLRNVSDEELVIAAQNGQMRALDILFERHYSRFERIAFKYCQDEGRARDAVQESCIQIMRYIGKLRSPKLFRSWSGRIVINSVRVQYRRNRRLVATGTVAEKTYADPRPSPLETVYFHQVLSIVDDFLNGGSRGEAQIFDSICVGGDSIKDVSEDAGCSPAALKTRVHRTRKSLRNFMFELGEAGSGAELGSTSRTDIATVH